MPPISRVSLCPGAHGHALANRDALRLGPAGRARHRGRARWHRWRGGRRGQRRRVAQRLRAPGARLCAEGRRRRRRRRCRRGGRRWAGDLPEVGPQVAGRGELRGARDGDGLQLLKGNGGSKTFQTPQKTPLRWPRGHAESSRGSTPGSPAPLRGAPPRDHLQELPHPSRPESHSRSSPSPRVPPSSAS